MKLAAQSEERPSVKVPPQAVMEPGEEEPGKLVGFVLKVTWKSAFTSVGTYASPMRSNRTHARNECALKRCEADKGVLN